MKPISAMALVAALMLPSAPARAEPPPPLGRAGDVYELTKTYETSMEDTEGSSGSSQGHDTLIERVIAVRPDGAELEYDLPKSESRAANWQFPARVFRPNRGELQLLNRAELESRVEGWLKKSKMRRAACGRWMFTWTAIRIECDPQAVIAILKSYDLQPADLREGAFHREAEAKAPAPLALKTAGGDGSTFVAEMEVDPDAIRRERAESDVVVAEVSGKPMTLEAAARARSQDSVSGTISVTFAADRAGRVERRMRVVKLETREPDGRVEKQTVTETLERRLISGRAPGR